MFLKIISNNSFVNRQVYKCKQIWIAFSRAVLIRFLQKIQQGDNYTYCGGKNHGTYINIAKCFVDKCLQLRLPPFVLSILSLLIKYTLMASIPPYTRLLTGVMKVGHNL